MKIKEKILLIEDERTIRGFMQAILTANGYDVLMAGTGAMANTMISSHCPDLIILDLGLPDMDGVELIRSIRQWSKLPIVVVSARMQEQDKVEALDLGADDFITKPFGTDELLARIRAALRHTRTLASDESVAQTGIFRAGELMIDFDRHRLLLGGKDVHLTHNEYRIVALLMQNPGNLISAERLMEKIWGYDSETEISVVWVYISYLRKKLSAPGANIQIRATRNVGYCLEEIA